jgi:hypothetical protein
VVAQASLSRQALWKSAQRETWNTRRAKMGRQRLSRMVGIKLTADVTPQQANHQGCVALTTSDPDSNPIVGFHKGLTFCVSISDQGALVMETRPPGPDNVLYLRERIGLARLLEGLGPTANATLSARD